MQNNKRSRSISLILILLMMFVMFYMFRMSGQNEMKYSELIGKFENQQITEFELNLGSGKMTYREAGMAQSEVGIVTVPDVNLFISDVRDYISAYNEAHPSAHMTYNYVAASNWGVILSSYLPILLLVGLMIFFYYSMNQQGGKIGNIGKARTKQGQEDGRKNTFADVAGADEEK
ncbi:MAG: hypothetical protein VB092_00755, partial [Oscillospiraceae bacterium]|nr:hypothetical protein [Oscillospiraceae bacterium]